jgi:hypothetical protein
MPRYMLLLADNPAAFKDVTPAQMQEVIGKYVAWTAKIKKEGRHLGGEKLSDEGGKRIVKKGAKPVVLDGPYAEAKDVVGGYYIIKAKDYDDAVSVALTCPHVDYGAYLDVRALDEM